MRAEVERRIKALNALSRCGGVLTDHTVAPKMDLTIITSDRQLIPHRGERDGVKRQGRVLLETVEFLKGLRVPEANDTSLRGGGNRGATRLTRKRFNGGGMLGKDGLWSVVLCFPNKRASIVGPGDELRVWAL